MQFTGKPTTPPVPRETRKKVSQLSLDRHVKKFNVASSSSLDEDRECSLGVVSQRGSGPSRCCEDVPLRQTGVLDR